MRGRQAALSRQGCPGDVKPRPTHLAQRAQAPKAKPIFAPCSSPWTRPTQCMFKNVGCKKKSGPPCDQILRQVTLSRAVHWGTARPLGYIPSIGDFKATRAGSMRGSLVPNLDYSNVRLPPSHLGRFRLTFEQTQRPSHEHVARPKFLQPAIHLCP